MPSVAGSGNTARTDTLPRVRALSQVLANQIAAGEVIERPASVVKELLENSLDAGARRIEVETESAGVGLIRVRDDGFGIHRDDLEVALRAHTTSKVSTLADLERIGSLGFRGEALPSIAAVSRLTLSSRTADSATRWEIRAEGGVVGEQRPVAGAPGTLVSVRELFFNTPARRKFLRTERTEHRHVEEVVRRVALSRFDVAFSFRHNGREILRLAAVPGGEDRGRRVSRICGPAFTDNAVFVEFEGPGMRLRGWLGVPSAARGSTDLQYFFINGRPVRDSTARHAIRQAYDSRIAAGRYPAYVLYLEMEPGAVDVNVHPAKQEVRYREARLVHDFIWRNLARGFDNALLDQAGADRQIAASAARGAVSGPSAGAVHDAPAGYATPDRYNTAQAPPAHRLPRSGGESITLIADRYAVVANAGELLLVDLVLARRVVLKQALLAAVASGSGPSRPLLLPLSLEVDEGEADTLDRLGELLQALGLSLRRTAPGAIAVHAVPAALAHVPAAELARGVLGWGAKGGEPDAAALCGALADLGAKHLEDLLAGGEPLESFLRALEGHAGGLGEARARLRLDAGEVGALMRRWRR
jgi:DNA mismatch repair protein MutL